MKKRLKVILKIALAVMVAFAIGYVVIILTYIQVFDGPVLSVVSSPELPGAEVWLLEAGFIDRGISLYVKSPSFNDGKPKTVTSLDWDGLYWFKQLRWSNDGRLAVFSLQVADGDSPEVIAFAFDFSSGQPVLPPWQARNGTSKRSIDEWKEQERMIMALVEKHNGLANTYFDRKRFHDNSRKIWFWQVPQG